MKHKMQKKTNYYLFQNKSTNFATDNLSVFTECYNWCINMPL